MPEEKKVSQTADQSDKTMAMLAHILGIFTSFVGPLIIYMTQKKEGFAKSQAKEALNFQITVAIAYLISFVLMFVLIGILLTWAVSIANLIFCILAAVAANQGTAYKYPFRIIFIK